MIEVNNIVKQYGSHLAVDHLSFRVEKGQIYGFLGPNGAGKSTTMNIITGYLASNEGTVVINGHDILEEPEEAKKCIGYLPEIPPLYQDMTVREYLHFVAGLKGVQKSEEEEILADIIEKTYLDSVKERLIKNLSKGYKQRVGLAQALVGNPEILILDEPTVGLDPKQIIEIRSLIKELAKDHTVILSSHILSEVSAICDQIMIISHGKLVACDTPDNLSRSVEGTITLKLSILDKENKAMQLMQEHFENSAVITETSEETDSQNSHIWQGTIETEGDKDIREELFYLLAEAKCPLLEMTQTKLSLEDIFLELTEDDNTEKEEA
jgi:ABC-2 type transport system ATP-binding protein